MGDLNTEQKSEQELVSYFLVQEQAAFRRERKGESQQKAATTQNK